MSGPSRNGQATIAPASPVFERVAAMPPSASRVLTITAGHPKTTATNATVLTTPLISQSCAEVSIRPSSSAMALLEHSIFVS